MRLRKICFPLLILSICCLLPKSNAYSQRTWDFNIWFNLKNDTNQFVTPEDFLNEDIRVLTSKSGLKYKLTYDQQAESFLFTGTVPINVAYTRIVFNQNKDTLHLWFPVGSSNYYYPNLKLTSGNYDFTKHLEPEVYNCGQIISGIERKVCIFNQPLSHFNSPAYPPFRKEYLTEIPLTYRPNSEGNGQEQIVNEQKEQDEFVCILFEISAEPIEGMIAFRKHLAKYTQQNYPEKERKAGVEGKVFVRFDVDTNGTLLNFEVLKSLTPQCDQVAIAAIKASGKWRSATRWNKKEAQRFIFPVKFKI